MLHRLTASHNVIIWFCIVVYVVAALEFRASVFVVVTIEIGNVAFDVVKYQLENSIVVVHLRFRVTAVVLLVFDVEILRMPL